MPGPVPGIVRLPCKPLSDVPEQLGKYKIRRAIGKGAMGIVYEGFDPIIDRIVAIKTIKKDELDHEEAEEHSRRFLIEAKAAGRLNHKNIVGIYDYGEEKGLSFIVMEFVQGKELKSFFAARHPFSMSQIVRLMGELLDALGYSHSRGVVHRDVKPDNIFVTDDGSVKLGDFGIARIDSTQKTHAGTVLGTPSYMSPEQIRGETADARSDIYAAGVILYQFLVGERPFAGGMVAVMQKVLMEMPKAPSEHNPSIPQAIDEVVLRALAKQPEARFATAAEFNRELTAAVGLSNAEDESESTMIMSADTLKSLANGTLSPSERTGTGAGTGTGGGTGTGTGSTSTGGRANSTSPTGRGGAIEEARRRAEEAKRRYEEDMRKAEVELQQAEEEQRRAETEAQAQAEEWLKTSQAQLDEARQLLEAGQALFTQHTLLIGGADASTADRASARKLRESAAAIGQFVSASYALSPAAQAELEGRQAELSRAAAAQDELADKIDNDGAAAHASLNQKLEVLEKRLAGQDGAWSAESHALETLDPAGGEELVDPIEGRLDKLATSLEQVTKGFASLQSQTLKLPPPQLERLAVIDAQVQAQGGFVTRLRMEADAARVRARAALEARRKAEEAARREAEAKAAAEAKRAAEEAARKRAEEEARLKAEAEARRLAEIEAKRKAEEAAEAEKKRLAEEEARRKAAEQARLAAEAEARRVAEERARREAEEAVRAKAEAERQRLAEAEARRVADEKAKREAAELAQRQAAEEARKLAEQEARRHADAEAKRVADELTAKVAKAEADRKAAEAAAAAQRKADEEARKKAEADAKREAQAEAKRKAEELAKQKADDEARKKAERQAQADAKRQAEIDAKAKSDAAAKAAADAQAQRKADEDARRKAEAESRRGAETTVKLMPAAVDIALDDDAEATMIAGVHAARDPEDAEATMVRPLDDKPHDVGTGAVKPAVPAPAPRPHPASNDAVADIPPKNKRGMMLPIVGVAVVAIAAGAWFALRPAPTPDVTVASAESPVAASAPATASAPEAAAEASSAKVATSASQPTSESPVPAAVQAPTPPAQPPAAQPDAVKPDAAEPDAGKPVVDPAAAAKHAEDVAAKKAADDEVARQKKLDDAAARKAKADADAEAKAKAKADADAKAKVDTDAASKTDADAKAKAADAAKQEAAETFRKGYETYLAGRVPEGIRQMEKADAMGAPGARSRLCAIYRKPTAAEGKDFLKEASKCKGVD